MSINKEVNERYTEAIVEEKLKESLTGGFKIEYKESKNPRIQNILKHSSKRKTANRGEPEFIITHTEYSDFCIVIECKKDQKFHKTENFDDPINYAVDGAIHYGKKLNKEFNVVAVGISGNEKNNILVDSYIILKNHEIIHLSDQFLNPKEIFDKYKIDETAKKQSYDELIQFNKSINEQLHDIDLKSDKRCLLISSILISVENKAFISSYKSYKNSKEILDAMTQAVISELKPKKEYEDLIINSYSSFLNNKFLNSNKDFIINLISEMSKNINSYIKTYEYEDILSEFYIEFLRYANHDKDLGIVLTPKHITELFTDLAEVNPNSVVIDNCCGTGGFLVSAMRKMILESKGNQSLIDSIKTSQLIGIEKQEEIFPLVLSNMKIHGDGKANIFFEDCLDFDKSKIKQLDKPTVGLLNPPFKPKKKDSRNKKEELEFILNNIDFLSPNGICVALVPMDCVNTVKGEGLILKEKLLKENTLLGVMSLPNEVFWNSNTSTVTCAMVIKAHVPHPPNYETYFGYWKDDGFIKRKIGRIDHLNKWEEIKKYWLETYRNKKSIDSFSILKKITAKDEWCAEAYLETDYSKLTEKDFVDTVKQYLAYRFLNND